MEGGVAVGVGGADVGAQLDRHLDGLDAAAHDAAEVGVLGEGDLHLGRVHLAAPAVLAGAAETAGEHAGGGHEGGHAAVEARVGVGAALGEPAHDAALAELGREEEGGRADPGRVQREQLALARIARAALEPDVRIRAVGKEGFDQRRVAPEDGGVQRRIPRAERVRVGPGVEQDRGQRPVAAVRGHHQRARAGRGGVVGIGAGREQQPGGRDVAGARREQQGREPAFVDHGDGAGHAGARGVRDDHGTDARARVHVGPGVEQNLDHAGMALRHRPHQGGLVFRGLAGVHVGAVGEQGGHRPGAAGAGGGHQRGLAAGEHRVGRGARLQQLPDQRGVAVLAGQVERGGPELIRGVHRGPCLDQPARRLEVVEVGGPVQGRRPVGLRRVHVDSFVQQRPHRGAVGVADRVQEPEVGRFGEGGRRHRGHEARGEQESAPLNGAASNAAASCKAPTLGRFGHHHHRGPRPQLSTCKEAPTLGKFGRAAGRAVGRCVPGRVGATCVQARPRGASRSCASTFTGSARASGAHASPPARSAFPA